MPTVDLSSLPVADTSPGLSAYVARPTTPGPWPGIVALHEMFGLDDVLRRQADHLASRGYLVVAPDLFSAGGALRCVRSVMASLLKQQGRAFHDIEAARQWLLGSGECTGKVGVIGFCMGGGFALLLATHGYDVSAVNYGQLPKDLEVLRGACPIVGSYGARDITLPGAAAKLERGLRELGVDHDVKEYPGAGHQFLNDKQNAPLPMRPLGKVLGMGPEPTAAADAWRRIEDFFAQQLGGPAGRD